MIEVLHQPEHRVTNLLFIGLNIMSILTLLGGCAYVVSNLFNSTDTPKAYRPFLLLVSCSALASTLCAALLLAALAQVLRYLASIASS